MEQQKILEVTAEQLNDAGRTAHDHPPEAKAIADSLTESPPSQQSVAALQQATQELLTAYATLSAALDTAKTLADGKQDPIKAGNNITIGQDGRTINATTTVTGVTTHKDLSNRDDADQHPISAITGLTEALETMQGGLSPEQLELFGKLEDSGVDLNDLVAALKLLHDHDNADTLSLLTHEGQTLLIDGQPAETGAGNGSGGEGGGNGGLMPIWGMTGSGSTGAISPTPAITSYQEGQQWLVRFNRAGVSRLDINDLGLRDIRGPGGAALLGDDIRTGSVLHLIDDGTRLVIVGTNTPIAASVSNANDPTRTVIRSWTPEMIHTAAREAIRLAITAGAVQGDVTKL